MADNLAPIVPPGMNFPQKEGWPKNVKDKGFCQGNFLPAPGWFAIAHYFDVSCNCCRTVSALSVGV